jgi:hypothetical protein
MNKQAWALALTVGLLGATSAAQAALSPPVDGMVYDDVLDLCWLQDAGASGPGTWDAAVDWAESLDFGGHTGWRLARMSNTSPTASITFCDGTNEAACRTTGNELGYMFFHNLGGSFPLLGNQGPFLNIPLYIWSGTEYSADDAWAFIAGSGNQDNRGTKGDQAYGWAVRPGQCRAAPAGAQPIPAVGVWGLGVLGLLLAGVVRARLR